MKSIGIYGKLPAHRDYVLLNLPESVEATLYDWLGPLLSEAQATLGYEAWLSAYLNASPCGYAIAFQRPEPMMYIGVMTSSVDAVGRYFPLLSGVQLTGENALVNFNPRAMQNVLNALVDQQVNALHQRQSIEVHYQSVVALLSKDLLTPWQDSSLAHLPMSAQSNDSIPLLEGVQSYWWALDQPSLEIMCMGLPSADFYQSLLALESAIHDG
ncbi:MULTISPECIES: type VI secretion system-associated protein TagF [Nitrincola]|uniref:Type VI secretion-associated protein, family n=1 Tax=Nitrincola nitratireducens TaxID=1229521 RepID=W9UV43_9GAMM|nr:MULTISPECIES: type VI secretion system-associated protein TagF [Nitrincola]EXJ10934.1 hypothetical protein D791_02032 [Nitrincola nitratireducens]